MKARLALTGLILLSACGLLAACSKTQSAQVSMMEKVKIVKIPSSKMIVSPDFKFGDVTVGDEMGNEFFTVMGKFWQNVVDRHEDIFQRVFFVVNNQTGKASWYFSAMNIDIGKFDTSDCKIIDFEGGYYAVATAKDPEDDNLESFEQTFEEIKNWVQQSKSFELDLGNRPDMSQMPIADDDEFTKAMGYNQNEIFVPIRIKK